MEHRNALVGESHLDTPKHRSLARRKVFINQQENIHHEHPQETLLVYQITGFI